MAEPRKTPATPKKKPRPPRNLPTALPTVRFCGFYRRGFAQQVRLPRQQERVEVLRIARDLREQRSIGNERRLNAELRGDFVAVSLDAVLQLDLRLRQRNVVRIASRPARQRLRIALESGAHRLGEARENSRVPLAEMHAIENRVG